MMNAENFKLCLQHLYPCTGYIQLGVGDGCSLLSDYFAHIPKLLAVEADATAFLHLKRNLPDRPGWNATNKLISDKAEECDFHIASNPTEHGLLEPSLLRSAWRNIDLISAQQKSAITLAMLLEHESDPSAYNWLDIDCLPATRLLKGLGESLKQFQVIQLRLLAQSTGLIDQAADKLESDAYLEAKGFHSVFVEETRNPAVLRVLYVRDPVHQFEIQKETMILENEALRDTVEQLAQEVDQLKQGKAQLEKDKGALEVARDEQMNLAKKRLLEVEQLETKLQSSNTEKLETLQRQQLMQEELLRAEAQLEIIKDLLVRGQDL